MKHTSINCCTFGVDLTTTDPKTGRIMMIQWTWEEVQEFVIEHGIDVTNKARDMLDTFLDDSGHDEEAGPVLHDEHRTFRCSIHDEPWPCSICFGQQRGG